MEMTDNYPGYAVTVGYFDGVHKGHRFLAERLKQEAAERGLKSGIVTFREHPRQILNSNFKPQLLSDPDDKTRLLQSLGTDLCITLHFTPELAGMSAEKFMTEILRDRLRARCLIMGYDHHFGNDGIISIERYRAIGEHIGMDVIPATAFIYNGKPVSSSRIRACLDNGAVSEAAEMLGRPYALKGIVVHGLQNGRKMGFPTANLGEFPDYLQMPANGVYAALAHTGGRVYKSMLNIGIRPTITEAEGRRTVEAHLLGFDNDIYGMELSLEFIEFIRPERRFDNLESLSEQLKLDYSTADRILTGMI